jgi:hypothetical protein
MRRMFLNSCQQTRQLLHLFMSSRVQAQADMARIWSSCGSRFPTQVAHENMRPEFQTSLLLCCSHTQVAHENMRPEFQASAPEDYSGLARRCWAQDPLTRPTFQVSQPVCGASEDQRCGVDCAHCRGSQGILMVAKLSLTHSLMVAKLSGNAIQRQLCVPCVFRVKNRSVPSAISAHRSK